ncbi:MAG: TetR family transcriptional regulator [Acutalibacteraceae bacterium]
MTAEETNTLSSILNAGKKEFLAKGFRSASLRSIVKEAGVTTGAFTVIIKAKRIYSAHW